MSKKDKIRILATAYIAVTVAETITAIVVRVWANG